jgi:hypothetical protein
MKRLNASTRDSEFDDRFAVDLDTLTTTLIILNQSTMYWVRRSTDIIYRREAPGQ